MGNIQAKINNRFYDVVEINSSEKLDAISEFDLKILAKDLTDYRNLYNAEVFIYYNGLLVENGLVDKKPNLELQDDDESLVVNLDCVNRLGELSCFRAKSDAHYQDESLIFIINNLMDVTLDRWFIDYSELFLKEETTLTTTIDLRSKETLFAQIVEAVKAIPEIHLRYGGFDKGKHVLQIGTFGITTAQIIQGKNILDLELKQNVNKVYSMLEAYGEYSGDVKIDLSVALQDSRTTQHPLYEKHPIYLDGNYGTYVMGNRENPNGCQLRKSFKTVKTKNDEKPTQEEINEAGYALWLQGVRFLSKSEDYETYSGDILFGIKEKPQVGDKVKIYGYIKEPVYDKVGNFVKYVETFFVNGDYRLTKLSTEFELNKTDSTNELIIYSFEATSNDEVEEEDSDIELFKLLEPTNEFDRSNSIESSGVNQIITTELTYNNNDLADCDELGNGGTTGKQFIINPPQPPLGATNVSTWYNVVPSNSEVLNVYQPTSVNPNDVFYACIKPANQNWPPPTGSNVTLRVYWQYY